MNHCRRLTGPLLGFVFTAFISACAHQPEPALRQGPILILVSIDGFRADYLNAQDSPHLWKMKSDGVSARRMIPAYPSLTFPNHYSIVTGETPDEHGIVNNTMRDPEMPDLFRLGDAVVVDQPQWWHDGEPIWVTATRQGVRSAAMFWPGSSAEIRGVRPWKYFQYDKNKSGEARVDQVLDWLGEDPTERPRMITLYFDRVDTVGHEAGPDSPERVQAVREVDELIGRLNQGIDALSLKNLVNVIVVSDHGMAQVKTGVKAWEWVKDDEAEWVANGALVGLWPKPGVSVDALAKRLKTKAKGKGISVYLKSEFPSKYGYSKHRRVPPLSLVANEGVYLITSADPSRQIPAKGAHGYDTELPSMRALFVADGPQFKDGVALTSVKAVELYGLMIRILGIAAGEPRQDRTTPTTLGLLRVW